jgi:alkanesulfonate monooxygenase SsuD/methylene tetrahydromethanopterin reductase-like flavin-dependent oxidoreductase (luciferase family)
VLGLLATETERIAFGSFMARATLRPPATLRTALCTVHRMAPGRLIAGIGSGDSLSNDENEMFGLAGTDVPTRLSALEATVTTVAGQGFPVWVGGTWDPVLAVAASCADGWNSWNTKVATFAGEWERLRNACHVAGRHEVVPTWGGLVELRPDRWDEVAGRDDVLSGSWDAIAEGVRAYVEAGARWVVLAPLAPGDPDNGAVVAAELAPRIRG